MKKIFNLFDNNARQIKIAFLFKQQKLSDEVTVLFPISYLIGETDEKGTYMLDYATSCLFAN